ncbi:MAG TPA: M24 family metallopeptidase, partial [Allosphingosinicella sp.]
MARIALGLLAGLAVTGSAGAVGLDAGAAAGNLAEAEKPVVGDILPLKERARVQDAWLKERLDTIVPALMRANGVDMWVLVAREYLEDPVVATMLDAESMRARRTTILIFFDPGGGKPIERLTVSRYGLGGLFAPSWDPGAQPNQWARFGEIVAERNPRRIAINSSGLTAFGDGMTLSQHQALVAALPEALRGRVVPTDALAVGWLETRIPAELEVYPSIVRLAHAIIAEGLSAKVISPGVTKAEDVVWWFRERIAGLGLATWFQPSLGIARCGSTEMLEGDVVIEKGDMLWTDFGITYLGLNTDTQHLAYVLRDGETDAPAGLKAGLKAANAVQDALTASFKAGLSGNAVLAAARARAIAAGHRPTIYSHPIGYHGHGAGPAIGFWDNQGESPTGTMTINPNTAWSIELSAALAVPEWDGQLVDFRLEEDAWFDGRSVTYLDGRQSDFHLIGAPR